MDRPYQAPAGGELRRKELGISGGFDEESLEQIPLTPQNCEGNSSDENLQQRNRPYLSFFRSPRNGPTTSGITAAAAAAERRETAIDQGDEECATQGGNRSSMNMRYSQSTTNSPLLVRIPPLPSGGSRKKGIPPRNDTSYRHSEASPRLSLGAETRRVRGLSPRTSESVLSSAMSNASKLFGESVLQDIVEDETVALSPTKKTQKRRRLSSLDALNCYRSSMDTNGAAFMGNPDEDSSGASRPRANYRPQEWLHTLDKYVQKAKEKAGLMLMRNQSSASISTHARELMDLEYLQQQHEQKMNTLFPGNDDDHPVYDFCLVLQPQEVYAFWSELLDFREELLGQEIVKAMDEQWQESLDEETDEKVDDENVKSSEPLAAEKNIVASPDMNSPRRRRTPLGLQSSNQKASPFSETHLRPPRPPLPRGASSTTSVKMTPTMTPKMTPAGNSTKISAVSPGLYSVAECSRISVSTRQSLFERAVGATPQTAMSQNFASTSERGDDLGAALSGSIRRKWGQSAVLARSRQLEIAQDAMSPTTMVRSFTRGTAITRPSSRLPSTSEESSLGSTSKSKSNPHEIRVEDIPNQVIPRGIAARTNGMLPFLAALRRGIVLRRHRAGHTAMYCKLFSTDGGDTIHYHWVEYAVAMDAFNEQRKRYSRDVDFAHPIPWAQMEHHEPRTGRKGSFRIADIVVVHPSRHRDPRSEEGDHGSISLRKSKSDYFEERTFSLVLRSRATGSLEEYEEKWCKNEGSDSQFRYLDFEAATEGEYWLVFRGLLLLHRDAAVGRFAEQRAAGIGSNYGRGDLEGGSFDEQNKLHVDEFLEPVTASFMEKLIVKWRGLDPKYMVGDTKTNAVPPPSDYFLGFKSPGTSIWGRLRYAGLYTQRVYAIDTNRVIIKVSCPSYRLMDVAEVLKLKVRTLEGNSWAPFRQDILEAFKPLNDPLELGGSPSSLFGGFSFSSADRQNIIDFIIRSRIRDSGAELGEATVNRPSGMDNLGRMIQARVPLHMPGKLEAIFQVWVYFWRKENWTGGRDGKCLTHDPMDVQQKDSFTTTSSRSVDEPQKSEKKEKELHGDVPSLFKRLFLGAFYQPLTSIEEYFGEKVAFYFAWLQHTAAHLVVLTAAGLIVFIVQVSTGNWDTPLRPYFAVFVMMWTFVVLVNWKKRANFLAYEWGTMNYQEQETTRPQFHGEYVRDPITGEDVLMYPKWKRWLKYCISIPVTLLFTFGTLFVILWVHANRDLQLARYLDQKHGKTGSQAFQLQFGLSAFGQKKPVVELDITGELLYDPVFLFLLAGMPGILGLCLPLMNFILMRLSVFLNNFENYRTVSEYRSQLIIKVFSSRFVSHFAVAYYYSFVSVGNETAIQNGFLRVAAAVLIYSTVARWWENFLHVAFPILVEKIRRRCFNARLKEQLREIELEEEAITRLSANGMSEEVKKRHIAVLNKRLLLDQAQDDTWLELMRPTHDSFPEYIQAVIQFTFVSCFSVVLPVTPLICLVNYLISMRLDAYKLCKGRRRPLAEKTGGIGVWEHLLHIVAVISVLTNCWLIGFTSAQFIWIGEQVGQVSLFAIVVCWEHFMLLIKYILQTAISPLPKTVQDAMKKERHVLDEQRNKSMRKRGRRSQYHRQSQNGGKKILHDPGVDEMSVASSVEDSFAELPHLGNSGSLRLTPKHIEKSMEKSLYSA